MCVLTVVALVLLIEAVFVMSSGWEFRESILGGRIRERTVGLFILGVPLLASLFWKYADRPVAWRILFGLGLVLFMMFACWFSIVFTWSEG